MLLLGNDMQIEADTKYLFTDSVEDQEKELLNNYIEQFNEYELSIFKKILEFLKYQSKYVGCKYNITKNSIVLCIKIYDDTGIKTFPFIHKVARKGYSISGGTFAFGVYTLETFFPNIIYCDYRAADCLKKSSILEFDIDNTGTKIITIKD